MARVELALAVQERELVVARWERQPFRAGNCWARRLLSLCHQGSDNARVEFNSIREILIVRSSYKNVGVGACPHGVPAKRGPCDLK